MHQFGYMMLSEFMILLKPIYLINANYFQITEFEEREEDFEIEQLDGGTNDSQVLCKHKDQKVHAHGLCKKCDDKVQNLELFLDISLVEFLFYHIHPP